MASLAAVRCLLSVTLYMAVHVNATANLNKGQLSMCAYNCSADAPQKEIWVQDNIYEYLRASLPAMSEMTACFFYDPAGYAKNPVSDLFQIGSSEDAYANGFNLVLLGKTGLQLWEEGAENTITNDLDAFDSSHRHCFVWSDGNYLKWFYDKTTPGVLELAARVGDSGKQIIREGSYLVIGCDQDTPGGSLQLKDMTQGHYADFQMWDSAFTDDEVSDIRCGAVGNVVNTEDIEIVGEQSYQRGDDFECTCYLM